MVLGTMHDSLSTAARAFCLDAADHLPTINEAVASPNFSAPAICSRSPQQSATRSSLTQGYASRSPAIAAHWARAVVLGRTVIWLHTRGDTYERPHRWCPCFGVSSPC